MFLLCFIGFRSCKLVPLSHCRLRLQLPWLGMRHVRSLCTYISLRISDANQANPHCTASLLDRIAQWVSCFLFVCRRIFEQPCVVGFGILCQVWDLAAYASCCVPASVFPLMWFEWLYVCWCIVAAARRHGQIRQILGLTAQQGRLQIQGCWALPGKTRQVCRQQRE